MFGLEFEFEWDEEKNRSNHSKHGVTFEQATQAFYDPRLLSIPDRIVNGEQRWHGIGLIRGVLMLLAVHTVQDEQGVEVVRIISARPANKREERLYARENG